MFIIVANFAGLLPVGVVPGVHAFTVTSHVTVTAMLALISFATVLFVGFARHGLHFFSLFVPHGVPAWMLPIIVPVELISFMIPVQPCASTLRRDDGRPHPPQGSCRIYRRAWRNRRGGGVRHAADAGAACRHFGAGTAR